MTISITASMLYTMCGGQFSHEGAEALASYCEVMNLNDMAIGDIMACFSEVPASWENEVEEEHIIAYLNSGNILISQ